MEDRVSNAEVRKRLMILKSGFDRFLSEGYVRWPQESLQKALGLDLQLDDDRIVFTFYAWQDAGVINYVGEIDCFVEILKPFPVAD